MSQQILIINGGSTYLSYKQFIAHLKNTKIDLDRLKPRTDWKGTLQEKLGKNYEVFIPKMPNFTNAQYKEWKIWFSKIIALLNNDLILIGHSLGGVFLAKYLDENKIPIKIKATILIAAPYDDETSETLGEFKVTSPLDRFSSQAGEVYLIHSKDDPVVPFHELEKYENAIPNIKTLVVEGMGHFKVKLFPKILSLIKAL